MSAHYHVARQYRCPSPATSISLGLTTLIVLVSPAIAALAGPQLPTETFYARPLDKVAGGACVSGDLNDLGQVAGYNYNRTSKRTLGFVTGPAGVGATPLRLRDGDRSGVMEINNQGQVIGWSNLSPRSSYTMSFISGLGGVGIRKYDGAGIYGINDAGQIVGKRDRWTFFADPAAGTETSLLKGVGKSNYANDISNAGHVLGQAIIRRPNGLRQSHTYMLPPGSERPILLGLPEATESTGYGLNDWGATVGHQYVSGSAVHYVSDAQGRVRLMGTLDNQPGGRSFGYGINNAGWMVGISTLSGSPFYRVTLAHKDGPLHDLTPLVQGLPPGVVLHDSPAINNHNQIAAAGTDGLCYLVCPTPDCQPTAP